MKQVGQFGLWVPEDTEAPDGPTQLTQLAEGTESTDGLNDLLARAGAQTGKSIIAGEHSTTSESYTALGTPDRVQNVVMPTDGLIFIAYKALVMAENGTSVGVLAPHIGGTVLKVKKSSGSVNDAMVEWSGGWRPITTSPYGPVIAGAGSTADVTTGQILGGQGGTEGPAGGFITAYLAAGTYNVEIRFKAVGGSKVIAKERKLWVWTRAF